MNPVKYPHLHRVLAAAPLTGYKVMRYQPVRGPGAGDAVSGADSRISFKLQKGARVQMRDPGIWMSLSRQYVLDHYSIHDQNVLITFAFNPADVTHGNLTDRETEFTVPSAIIKDFEILPAEDDAAQPGRPFGALAQVLAGKLDSFNVFRGVKDIYLSQVDPRHVGDGYWGQGTYYALYKSDAEDYATQDITGEMDRWAFVIQYAFSGSCKEFGQGELLNLDKNYMGVDLPKRYPRESIFVLTQDEDGINPPEGGEQVLITQKAKPTLKAQQFWVYLAESENAEILGKMFKLKMGPLNSVGPFKMSMATKIDNALKTLVYAQVGE